MNETITINTSISPRSMRILLKESLKTPDIFWVTGYQMEYNKNGQTYYKIYPAYSMSANSKNSLEEKLQKETDLFLQNNAEALNHDAWTAAANLRGLWCGTGFQTTEYGFGKSVLLRRCQCICGHNCGSQCIGQCNSYGKDLGFTVSFS